MYKRSDLRHACFRAKKKAETEANKVFLSLIEPLLIPGQRWENFGSVWDLLVDGEGKIKIIKPETDYEYIHSTCVEASIYKKNGVDFDSFTERQINIITIVESQMLDGIMRWENYNKAWGVEVDKELKLIKTKVFNVDPRQIEVTEEMIHASMKEEPIAEEAPMVLEAKPMDDNTKKAFEEFLARKYGKKD